MLANVWLLLGLCSILAGTGGCDEGVPDDNDELDICPLVENKKYHVETNFQLNWFAAYMHCRSKGWRLATILNKEQNDQMLTQIRNTYRGDGTYRLGFWIGGTDLGYQGSWQWMDTGKILPFKDWLPGQPNSPQTEHCLDLWMLKWNDADCKLPLYFVCEYSVYEQSCKAGLSSMNTTTN